jgi:hypothetical protein
MWLLDPPWFYSLIWNLFKWFLKKKLRERIHLISKKNEKDMAKMRAKFDPSQLPVSLGGTLTDEAANQANQAWLAERIRIEGESNEAPSA